MNYLELWKHDENLFGYMTQVLKIDFVQHNNQFEVGISDFNVAPIIINYILAYRFQLGNHIYIFDLKAYILYLVKIICLYSCFKNVPG